MHYANIMHALQSSIGIDAHLMISTYHNNLLSSINICMHGLQHALLYANLSPGFPIFVLEKFGEPRDEAMCSDSRT